MKLSVAQALEKYSKPGSQGQILPATYFCAALELRMVFTDEWIENREHYLWTPIKQDAIPKRSAILLVSRTVLQKNCTQFNFEFCHYQVCGNLCSLLLHKSLYNILDFVSQLTSLK